MQLSVVSYPVESVGLGLSNLLLRKWHCYVKIYSDVPVTNRRDIV